MEAKNSDVYKARVGFDSRSIEKEFQVAHETVDAVITGIGIILIIFSVISAIRLILSLMLVFGANSDRPGLVKPWIVSAITLLTVITLINVALIIILFANGWIGTGVFVLITVFFAVVIQVYFILVVNSFHTTLLQSGSMPMN